MDRVELMAVGGHAALDLLNSTVRAQTNGPIVELLVDGPALLEWMGEAGLLTDAEIRELVSRFSGQTLNELALDAIDIREWFRRAISQILDGDAIASDVVRYINELLAHAGNHHGLEVTPDGLELTTRRRWSTDSAVLVPIAEAIAEILVSVDRSLVRNCENPTCPLWFYDRTKAHRRRWCSMAACGNRAKARAYRDRHRANPGAE